jgi:hypothetical protein
MSTRRKRIEMLLARKAVEPLSETETARLARLLNEHPDIDRDAFERAAATVLLAAAADADSVMPSGLRNRLRTDALSVLARGDSNSS